MLILNHSFTIVSLYVTGYISKVRLLRALFTYFMLKKVKSRVCFKICSNRCNYHSIKSKTVFARFIPWYIYTYIDRRI